MTVKNNKWILIAVIASAVAPAVAADRYTIDPDHTFPSLEFSHMGLSIWRGKFNRTTGKVTFDRAARTGSAEVRVDAASVDFGHDKMNEFAVTGDWLNVAAYPAMTYAGTLKFKGDVPVAMDGKLTLLGVTKPVPLKINSFKCTAHPMLKREVCGADAEGERNRADFGMTRYADGEAGKIRVRIQVEAIKDGP